MNTYTTAQIISATAQGIDLGAAAILDSAANVQAGLDRLELLAAAGKICRISLTETGLGIMDVTPVHLTADIVSFKAHSPYPVIGLGDRGGFTLTEVERMRSAR